MSFSGLFGSQSPAPPASPSVLGLMQPDSPSSVGSPRRSIVRKKRKQANLLNPAQSFNFSSNKSHSPGFGLDSLDDSGLNFTAGRFLAELSPDASAAVSSERGTERNLGREAESEREVEREPEPEPEGNTTHAMSQNMSSNTHSSSPPALAADSPKPPTSPTAGTKALGTNTTTPDGTPDRALSTPFRSLKIWSATAQKSSPSPSPKFDVSTSPSNTLTKGRARSASPSSFAADGSPISKSASLVNSRILSPIENTVPIKVSSASSTNKPYAPLGRSFSPLGKGAPLSLEKTASLRKPSPLGNGSTLVSDLSGTERSRLLSSGGSSGDVSHSSSPLWRMRDVSNSSTERDYMSTPRKFGSLDRSSSAPGFYDQPLTPGTPDSECEVEHLTQTVTTFEVDDHQDDDSFHNTTPDRSATVGPSPRRTMANTNNAPEIPSTPAPQFPYDSLVTPARSSALVAQTPRSILRPLNTPATGNSVRFNSVAFYKVIERLPEFHASVQSPQESLGDEGTAPLGIEPIEKSEVPMVEPSSSDEEDLDFQPTHHHTFDSIDSDGFDEEVERNTLANSQTAVVGVPYEGSFADDGTPRYLSDNSLEATTKWLQDFVSEAKLSVKGERTVSDSTQRTVSGSSLRTVSSSSLNPLDVEEPIRHTSPLNPPCEEEGDISQMENLNNSSEWVVPADLSFGDDTLPRLEGASFSIAAMVDPDATAATTRGIAPRRPHSLPAWADVPTINKIASSPEREDEPTPVGPIRARLAASKYVSTTPLKHAPSSGSASPRLGTSPKTSPPAPLGSAPRRPSTLEDKENRVPVLSISSPMSSPRKTSPSLPSVSEDEELSNEQSTQVDIKPKQPVFGSLTHSRPSTLPFGRRARSHNVFEDTRIADDSDDEHKTLDSPTKPMLEGKGVGSFAGDISKLSLVDMSGNVSGNASNLSFLDHSGSPRAVSSTSISSTSTSRIVSSASAQSSTSVTSNGSAAELLGSAANGVFDARADQVASLEAELAHAYSVITVFRAEVANRDAQLEKLYSLSDDVPRMQDEMKAMRREAKELRAQLLASENSRREMEAKLKTVEDERVEMDTRAREVEHEVDELKAHLADAEHAKEELQHEINALHAAQPSASLDRLNDELRDKLSFANEELEFARSELQQTASEAARLKEQLAAAQNEAISVKERLSAAENDLQTARDECKHLTADLDAARVEAEHLHEDLETATSELEVARSERGAATSDLEKSLASARQEIAEFKAELRYVGETNAQLKAALSEAHDEADSLRAQLADSKGVEADTAAELRAARDECAALSADLDSARADYDALRSDLDAAREQAEHLRTVADDEAHAKTEAQRAIRTLEDKAKKAETALADAVAQVHRLEAERDELQQQRGAQDTKDKDRRIKLLEQKVRRLADEREMMNVAVNSAQMETEFYKRRLATAENAKPPVRPLRAMKQTPAAPTSAPRPSRVAS